MRIFYFMLPVCLILVSCSDDSIFDAVKGKWNFAASTNSCKDENHFISFSTDFTTATITFNDTVDFQGKRNKVFEYEVLGNGKKYIDLRYKGETRTNKKGEPIVWQLGLINNNSYAWRNKDWPQKKFTPPIKRCEV